MTTNIRFFHTNLIDIVNTELNASTEVTVLPVSNLRNLMKSIPWRSTGKEFEYVDVDLGQNYLIQAFALTGHNLTENADVSLCGDDSDSFYESVDSNHPGFWKFNGNGNDESTSSNDLTAASVATTDYQPARQDRAVHLNGTDAYFHIANASAGDFDFDATDDFSIEAWVTFDTDATVQPVVSKWDGSAGYYLEKTADDEIKFTCSDGTLTDNITGSSQIESERWYHVSVTADRDGELNLYLNGSSDATPVTMTTGSLSNSADFYVGRKSSAYLDGMISQLSISNTARSAAWLSDTASTPKTLEEISFAENVMLSCFTDCNHRYWRLVISDSDNASGFIEIGRLFLGDYFEPQRNYHGNWNRRVVDPSSITVTKNNYDFSDLRDKYTEIDLKFPKEVQIQQDDIVKYENMFKSLGQAGKLFISLDYENYPSEWTYYGTLNGEFNITHLPGTGHTQGRWIINNLRFKESR